MTMQTRIRRPKQLTNDLIESLKVGSINQSRFHQSLDYKTPDLVYFDKPEVKLAA